MATPKRGNAPNATRNRGASIAGQETAVARLTRERDETPAYDIFQCNVCNAVQWVAQKIVGDDG
jgi:hypothetical protein